MLALHQVSAMQRPPFHAGAPLTPPATAAARDQAVRRPGGLCAGDCELRAATRAVTVSQDLAKKCASLPDYLKYVSHEQSIVTSSTKAIKAMVNATIGAYG